MAIHAISLGVNYRLFNWRNESNTFYVWYKLVQIWSTITNFVSSIWNSVTSWFSRVASSVAEKMGQALNFIITKGSEWVSNIWNTVTSFASKVADGFKELSQM